MFNTLNMTRKLEITNLTEITAKVITQFVNKDEWFFNRS